MDGKIYNLEDRTLEFAKRITKMCNVLTKDEINKVFVKHNNEVSNFCRGKLQRSK